MQFTNHIKSKWQFFVALSALFVLASCGSYQYSGYDNDGIYSSEREPAQVVEVRQEKETTESDASYFKNYFSEKSDEYEAIASESEVFTDVDTYGQNNEGDVNTGQAGWGSANDETIIVIDNGWNNWGWNAGFGWGWNDPWLWNGGFGWGWNRWGWGWNNWGWNAGFGWGWGWNAGFGWGWNNWGWGWNNFWGPPIGGFYNNNLAFNYGRRGAFANNGFSRVGRTSSALNRRDASRRNVAMANTSQIRRNSGRNVTRNYGRNVTRNSGRNIGRSSGRNISRNNSSSRPRVNSSSRPRTRINSSSRPRTRSVSPSRSTRSSGVRSSSGRSMSRSSGGSMRSSGSRGGGRRR